MDFNSYSVKANKNKLIFNQITILDSHLHYSKCIRIDFRKFLLYCAITKVHVKKLMFINKYHIRKF